MPYFDWNATTPVAPAARAAWTRAADEAWQNPSSLYRSAARVRNLLEMARTTLAERLACDPRQVVFNSGATESVNAVFHYCASRSDLRGLPVLLSPIEHPCVFAAAKRFFKDDIRFCQLDASGRTDPDSVADLLEKERFALVAVMAANNETGIVQPWREIGDLCRRASTPFMCDMAQWAGKRALDPAFARGFALASAHKFGGPKGCGFLVVPSAAGDFQGQVGGEQEHGLRGGTEDYPGVAAMLAALEATETRTADEGAIAEKLRWRETFQETVKQRIPGARIAGEEAERLWNTVSLVLPLGANDRWVRKLDRAGFQVSTGSACSSGKEEPSHVLAALGFAADEAKRAIRISSGWETSREDWEQLTDALEAVFHEMKSDGDSGGPLTQVARI